MQHLVVVRAQADEVLARVVTVVPVQMVQLHALVKSANNAGLRHFLPELKGDVVVFADAVTFDVIVLVLFLVTVAANTPYKPPADFSTSFALALRIFVLFLVAFFTEAQTMELRGLSAIFADYY